MRLRTLVVWVIVLGLLAWAGYTIVYASSIYVEIGGLIERVVNDASARRRAAVATGMPDAHREFLATVRRGIQAGAQQSHVGVAPDDVLVSEISGGVSVTVRWYFPLISYNYQTYITIPMSTTRSITFGP